MRIEALSPELANQIAAGEVIERPASVLKELLENSLDAGADRILIQLKAGGSQLIEVTDNGHGVHPEDLTLSLARHATSKIKALADLEQVSSLGFRGEALASISSVATVCLTSKTADENNAWSVSASGRDMTAEVKPASHPPGTTVSVSRLFFNTPARRKFLRSERTELWHLENLIKRLALSRFDVAFQAEHEGKSLFNLPPALEAEAQNERIAKICGRPFLTGSVRVETEASDLKLTGWLGLAESARSQTDVQYFYLNGRAIRDKLIQHALRQVYQDHLPAGRHAAYVLYLTLDPAKVDVNVHPTKHEVRFREARLIHDFLVSSLQAVFTNSASDTIAPETAPAISYTLEPTTSAFKVAEPQRLHHSHSPREAVRRATTQFQQPTISKIPAALDPAATANPNPFGVVKALLAQRYLITEHSAGCYFIDTHQAWAQGVRVQWQQEWAQTGTLASSTLIEPLKLTVTVAQQQQLTDSGIDWLAYGLEWQLAGPKRLWLRALPSGASTKNLQDAAWLTALVNWSKTARKPEEGFQILSQGAEPNWRDPSLKILSQQLQRWVAQGATVDPAWGVAELSWSALQEWFAT